MSLHDGLPISKDCIMRNDSRLSRMLHVLLHMARHEGPMTSDEIARMLGTNAVVVRRTMAGLRDSGYVRSEKGHGGGWAIQAELETRSEEHTYELQSLMRISYAVFCVKK